LTANGIVEDQIRCARDKICQEKLSDPPVLLGIAWQRLVVQAARW
jgi:hypothetical protein